MPLSACKSKKEEPKQTESKQTEAKETEPKEKEYEIDDDSYQTFQTLLQNLAEGLNEGDVIWMRKALVGGIVPGTFMTISGNYIIGFELIDILNKVILEGDEIEQNIIEKNLVNEDYEEYTRQATKACALKVAINQTTLSDSSVSNYEVTMIALKIDGKWAVVPWV